jgi:cell division protein FtsW
MMAESMHGKHVDKLFLSTIIVLIVVGFFIFTSASLGLLAREGTNFWSIAWRQLLFGLGLGSIAMTVMSFLPYKILQKYALLIVGGGLLLTLVVFIPGIGFRHGGATRWLNLGPFSFQPAEALKIAFIVYMGAWLAKTKAKVATIKDGLVPFFGMLAVVGAVLLTQPDTDTFLVIFIAAIAMFIVAGGRWLHIGSIGAVCVAGLLALALVRPYIKDRLLIFLNPSLDPLGAGYQIQQSLIAVGSGGFFGRGFGQSLQKFNFLPEPIGDSIFAVFAEEWGFIGSVLLILLFMLFAFRGLRIASRAPAGFPQLLVTGIIVLIVSQSLINIASMLGMFPLSGMPLLFVSQGGTALLFTLAEVGIVLNISRYQKGS